MSGEERKGECRGSPQKYADKFAQNIPKMLFNARRAQGVPLLKSGEVLQLGLKTSAVQAIRGLPVDLEADA